jgi:putative DNA primase/helicase
MNSIASERTLLGSILLKDVWEQANGLSDQDFSLDAHQRIFRRMRDLAESNRPIDETTLTEELSRHGELDLVGGAVYVASLTDGAVERKDITHLVAAVKEQATRRSAAKVGERLQRIARDQSVSLTALAETAESIVPRCMDPGDALAPQFSEEALALRFSRQHAEELQYVAAWGNWYYWDGICWREDDTLAVFDRCRAICRRASAECSDKQEPVAVRLAASSTVAAVERLARADRRHAATVDQWDADPWLLNTPLGTVDLRGEELHEHDRGQFLTKLTAVGPGGKCELWLRFLNRVTDGDAELASFLQRVIGYSLTGSTREHALFFLYGTGGNGKSVFLSTIAGLLGDYAKTAHMSAFTVSKTEQHPTDLAGLRGARFVTAIETEVGTRWALSKIKCLTGGDRIAARFMRQNFFEYVPQFKLVVAGNHKPELRFVDEAIRRRLHLIPFTVTIPRRERDRNLDEKLKEEYPGILQWAIDGCVAWQRDGLNPPAVVRDATAEYIAAEDALGRWLEDRCVLRSGDWTSFRALFADWQQWCEQTGEPPGSEKRFTQALQARGFESDRSGGAGTRGFAGVSLRADALTHSTHSPVMTVTRARA